MPPSSPAESDSSVQDPTPASEASAADASDGSQDASATDEAASQAPPPSSTTLGAIHEPQRLHPLTLLLRVGASLPALVVILLPLLRNPGSTENLTSLILGVLYGLFALPAILLQYWRFSYRITPKQIVIQSGVLTRKNRSIPIERVQNIQIERNLVARILGLAKVTLETAGSSSTEGSLEYVHLDEAREIRQVVRSFQREEPADAEADTTAENETDVETLFDMSLRRVLLSGAFRFSLLYLAVIFSVLEFFNPETLMQRFVRAGRLEWLAEIVLSHPAVAILATVLVAILLGWMSGIAVHLARYYDFQLWLDGDKLRKRHGLFTVTEGTIPLDKVQTLILRTNPFMRAFGWYELKVQTVGINVDEQGHRVIAPFAGGDRILELARRVRAFDLPDTFENVSRLTIRRRFFRYTAVFTLALAPTIYFWPADWMHLGGVSLPWWGLALVPFILGWALLQYHNHEYAAGEDGFYIRRGVLSHYLWIVPTEKFHVFHATASIFQRRLGLKTLFVDTAGAATFAYPEVIDVPADAADAQFEALYHRFKTLYRDRVEAATGAPDTRLADDERPRLPTDDASD